MKHSILLIATLPFIASCSMFDGMVSRNVTDSEFPGIQTEINCNPAPVLIFSKSGDLIETVNPILHPTCNGQSSIGAVKGETAGPNWFSFGPATARASNSPTEATDDETNVNPLNVASDDDAPATDTPLAVATSIPPESDTNAPDVAVDPAVVDAPDPVDEPEAVEPPAKTDTDCDGASHCEPDSKTDPEQHKRWQVAAKRNAAAAAKADSE